MTPKALTNKLIKLCNATEPFVATINGAWGVGKTRYWRDFAKNYLTEKKYAYVSLFGLQSIEEIRRNIILQIAPKEKKIQGFKEHLQDFKSSLGIKDEELNFGLSGSALSVLLGLFSTRDFENVVVCIDDFERISDKLSQRDVMGVISELKEQKQCKVVMILHQEKNEASKADYAEYKEKIVDYEFLYESAIADSYALVDKELTYFKQYPLEYFQKHDIRNIRVMQRVVRALNDFTFVKPMKLDSRIEEEVALSVISCTVIYAVLHITDFKGLNHYWMRQSTSEIKNNPNQDYENALKFYIGYNDYSDRLRKHIESFLMSSSIDEDEVKSVLAEKQAKLERYDVRDRLSAIRDTYYFDVNASRKKFDEEIESVLFDDKIDMISAIGFQELLLHVQYLDASKQGEYRQKVIALCKKSVDNYFTTNPKMRLDNEDTLRSMQEYDLVLKEYIDSKTQEIRKAHLEGAERLVEMMTKIMKQGGWGHEEKLLDEISEEVYEHHIKMSSKFFETAFHFVSFINRFSDTPFKEAREKIINVLKKLKDENENDNAFRMQRLLKILEKS